MIQIQYKMIMMFLTYHRMELNLLKVHYQVRERHKFFLWSVSEFRPLRGGGGGGRGSSRKSANWSLKGLNEIFLFYSFYLSERRIESTLAIG